MFEVAQVPWTEEFEDICGPAAGPQCDMPLVTPYLRTRCVDRHRPASGPHGITGACTVNNVVSCSWWCAVQRSAGMTSFSISPLRWRSPMCLLTSRSTTPSCAARTGYRAHHCQPPWEHPMASGSTPWPAHARTTRQPQHHTDTARTVQAY